MAQPSPSPKVAAALDIARQASGDQAVGAYQEMLRNIKTLSSPPTAAADLTAILDAFLSAGLGIVATRQLVDAWAATAESLDNDDMLVAVGTHALTALAGGGAQPAGSFLDQTAGLRERVAGAHERNDDFADAARVLAEIPLETSQRKVADAEKARVWVRIARDYLEVDDSTSAKGYVNKLKNIMHGVADRDLTLHFKLSQARVQDAERDFLGASMRYHDVSQSAVIAEDDRLAILARAVKCAILAPAGPLRSRALARLYKDERAPQLGEFSMLEKMFLDRLLAPDEVAAFARDLQPHQLARTADGSTVLDRAVVEHNLLGASRLYANIGLDALGGLLNLDGDRAEETTARMIEQGRLVGRIDQLRRVVFFGGTGHEQQQQAAAAKGSGGGRAEVVFGKEMRRWDANVQSVAEDVESVTNMLQKEFPDFVAANLIV